MLLFVFFTPLYKGRLNPKLSHISAQVISLTN